MQADLLKFKIEDRKTMKRHRIRKEEIQMNKLYIMRRIDKNGRLVIPKNLRTLFRFEPNTEVKIIVKDTGIFITRSMESENKQN